MQTLKGLSAKEVYTKSANEDSGHFAYIPAGAGFRSATIYMPGNGLYNVLRFAIYRMGSRT